MDFSSSQIVKITGLSKSGVDTVFPVDYSSFPDIPDGKEYSWANTLHFEGKGDGIQLTSTKRLIEVIEEDEAATKAAFAKAVLKAEEAGEPIPDRDIAKFDKLQFMKDSFSGCQLVLKACIWHSSYTAYSSLLTTHDCPKYGVYLADKTVFDECWYENVVYREMQARNAEKQRIQLYNYKNWSAAAFEAGEKFSDLFDSSSRKKNSFENASQSYTRAMRTGPAEALKVAEAIYHTKLQIRDERRVEAERTWNAKNNESSFIQKHLPIDLISNLQAAQKAVKAAEVEDPLLESEASIVAIKALNSAVSILEAKKEALRTTYRKSMDEYVARYTSDAESALIRSRNEMENKREVFEKYKNAVTAEYQVFEDLEIEYQNDLRHMRVDVGPRTFFLVARACKQAESLIKISRDNVRYQNDLGVFRDFLENIQEILGDVDYSEIFRAEEQKEKTDQQAILSQTTTSQSQVKRVTKKRVAGTDKVVTTGIVVMDTTIKISVTSEGNIDPIFKARRVYENFIDYASDFPDWNHPDFIRRLKEFDDEFAKIQESLEDVREFPADFNNLRGQARKIRMTIERESRQDRIDRYQEMAASRPEEHHKQSSKKTWGEDARTTGHISRR